MKHEVLAAAATAILTHGSALAASRVCPVVYSPEIRNQIVERVADQAAWLADAYNTSSPDITQDGRSLIGNANLQRPDVDVWIVVKPYGLFGDESLIIVADPCELERVTNKQALATVVLCPQQPDYKDAQGRLHYFPPGSWCVRTTNIAK